MLTSAQKKQIIAITKPNALIMKDHFFVLVTVDIQEMAFIATVCVFIFLEKNHIHSSVIFLA